MLIYSDDMGTATAGDLGVYQTTANGSAVVDADHFASAVALNAGVLAGADVTHESTVFGVEDAEKPLWEALGLSVDPKISYDIVLTLTADADVGGSFTLKGKYVI